VKGDGRVLIIAVHRAGARRGGRGGFSAGADVDLGGYGNPWSAGIA